jgi:lipoic acid synthetase
MSKPTALVAEGRRLHVRWMGRTRYRDAHALQQRLWTAGPAADDWLLLLEHPPVYTMGLRAKAEHVLVDPATVGAELVHTDRGGDVTYHGPGQLVGYPILSVPVAPGVGPAFVAEVEQLVIDSLADLGLPGAGRLPGYPGVWVDPTGSNPRKICAIGVRRSRGRTMHGFALNVDPDMAMFGHIVPCGIPDKPVTSLAAEGLEVTMADAVEVVTDQARQWLAPARPLSRAGVVGRLGANTLAPFSRGEGPGQPVRPSDGGVADGPVSTGSPVRLLGRLARAGVDPSTSVPIASRKPEWLRAKAEMGEDYRRLRSTLRSLDLVTVCEEAGCPNIFECWRDGTATFMINGDRCTRACGFCLVDTRKPLALDAAEPGRVADAVAELHLAHAVVTCVARDDLADGGAGAMAATIEAIRRRSPATAVEVLISDCKGDPGALGTIFAARPDVLNHNLETVARLQSAVRPSAGYARSLAVLSRAGAEGLRTKSGFMVGLGETVEEVHALLDDLAGVGVAIVTVGQYLRPTTNHLPVARWWEPAEFAALAAYGRSAGIAHVEASPLTRSSYHARQAAAVPA